MSRATSRSRAALRERNGDHGTVAGVRPAVPAAHLRGDRRRHRAADHVAGGYRALFGGGTLGTTITGTTGITSFAWQAGGGATYAFSDRVTLDLGYRFFALSAGDAVIRATNASGTIEDTVRTRFSASELLLTLRIHEPFRGWRRAPAGRSRSGRTGLPGLGSRWAVSQGTVGAEDDAGARGALNRS